MLKGEVEGVVKLKDFYAIEGITIVDDKIYVANEGYYHKAKLPRNVIQVYGKE